ncbi:MAG: hypothetical protein OEZ06_20095 [Myxococcales bacterium]|nr:hypothetical protein [Myxococcales bacterium]
MEPFVFGGVRFELRDAIGLELDAEDARYCFAADAPSLATLELDLERERENASEGESPEHRDAGITWQRGPERIDLRSRGLAAELKCSGEGRYLGRARVDAGQRTLTTVMNAAACALSYASGGLILHAAAITDGQRAVALIGPSGAGKTTALRQSGAARFYALDRISVARRGGRVWAWPLAGGEEVDRQQYREGVLELATLVRVGRAQQPRVERATGPAAMLLIRESTHAPQQRGLEGEDEANLLERAFELSTAMPVYRLWAPLERGADGTGASSLSIPWE